MPTVKTSLSSCRYSTSSADVGLASIIFIMIGSSIQGYFAKPCTLPATSFPHKIRLEQ